MRSTLWSREIALPHLCVWFSPFFLFFLFSFQNGKSFTPLLTARGALDVLLALGFVITGTHVVLPEGVIIPPEVMDYVLRMEDIYAELERKKEDARLFERKKAEEEKERLRQKIANDRREAAQREVRASHARTVPFTTQTKGCSDLGIGKNTGG